MLTNMKFLRIFKGFTEFPRVTSYVFVIKTWKMLLLRSVYNVIFEVIVLLLAYKSAR